MRKVFTVLVLLVLAGCAQSEQAKTYLSWYERKVIEFGYEEKSEKPVVLRQAPEKHHPRQNKRQAVSSSKLQAVQRQEPIVGIWQLNDAQQQRYATATKLIFEEPLQTKKGLKHYKQKLKRALDVLVTTGLNLRLKKPNPPEDTSQGMILHHAVEQENLAATQVLLQYNDKEINVNQGSNSDWTALHFAVEQGELAVEKGAPLEIVKLLVSEPRVKVNQQNRIGMTAFHLATMYGLPEFVKHLGSNSRVQVNLRTREGMTALHIAVEEGHFEIVRYLVSERCVEMNEQDIDGNTPLHIAVEYGHFEILKFLLKQPKIDVSLQNSDMKTALELARAKGRVEKGDVRKRCVEIVK